MAGTTVSMAEFVCPACHLVNELPDYMAGQKTKCEACGEEGLAVNSGPPVPLDPSPMAARKVWRKQRSAIAILTLGLLTLSASVVTGYEAQAVVGGCLILAGIVVAIPWGKQLWPAPVPAKEILCPYCHSTNPPTVTWHITTPGCLAGLFLFPFGLIYTLLGQEARHHCRACKIRLG